MVNSITILNGQIGTSRTASRPQRSVGLTAVAHAAPTFDVQPDHAQTITFGTCRFFFQNVGPTPLEYCWLSLVRIFPLASD